MTTYTATFRTDAEWAEHDFEAETSEQALQLAHELWEHDHDALNFMGYDMPMPLDEIEISDSQYDTCAVWHSDDMRLRLAAQKLLEALEEASSLLSACALNAERLGQRLFASQLLTSLSTCREAIAKAKPDAQAG